MRCSSVIAPSEESKWNCLVTSCTHSASLATASTSEVSDSITGTLGSLLVAATSFASSPAPPLSAFPVGSLLAPEPSSSNRLPGLVPCSKCAESQLLCQLRDTAILALDMTPSSIWHHFLKLYSGAFPKQNLHSISAPSSTALAGSPGAIAPIAHSSSAGSFESADDRKMDTTAAAAANFADGTAAFATTAAMPPSPHEMCSRILPARAVRFKLMDLVLEFTATPNRQMPEISFTRPREDTRGRAERAP